MGKFYQWTVPYGMHFADLYGSKGPTFSFEFFPPKSDRGWSDLERAIESLEPLEPDFVSVTYGAGGSTRERTHDLVTRLRDDGKLDPVPHLTCVSHDHEEIESILVKYARAGISNILAIRGDPPESESGVDPYRNFRHASDLIRAIRRFNESGAHPDPKGFGVAAAGFPEGHPETPNSLHQMDHLKAKVDEGVDVILTQLFFDNHSFEDWRERCTIAGIKVPIVAGIMPITSVKGLERMAQLAAGTRFPASLLKAVERTQSDPEAVQRIGIHWATEQCLDLLDKGVSGIHYYTLNRSEATLDGFRTLGVRGVGTG